MLAATVLVTGSQAEDKCFTNNDRLGFGAIGVIQGAVIGGPVGALWALGTMKYAELYENPSDCNQKKLASTYERAKVKIVEAKVIIPQNTELHYDSYKEPVKEIEEKVILIQQITHIPEQKEIVSVDKKLDAVKQSDEKDLDVRPYEDVVVYNSFINFNYDSYVIQDVPQSLDLIEKKNIESIIVDGHTDKRGTNEYNFALGLKRANEVKQLLVDYDFDEKLIKTVSYGESNPISKNDASNRRVDLKVKYNNITK